MLNKFESYIYPIIALTINNTIKQFIVLRYYDQIFAMAHMNNVYDPDRTNPI